MVSPSSAAPSISYADRAKLASSHPSSNFPSPSSTSTTDVEKHPDDAPNGDLVNGISSASIPTPNIWVARKEQMAARTTSTAASSSSSPTLAASPPIPIPPLPNMRGVNGVDPVDTSDWPQVTAAVSPAKDKSGSKNTTTPTPTPKKGEKKKWVLIPPIELQAAADAATRGRSSPRHASATTSTHSSPKNSSRGRRLPTEDITADSHRRSPSRLSKHAYTHPLNSPTHPSTSFTLPVHPTEPHHPPLTLQRRPVSPSRSGPVAGYRDIDDLTRAAGRLVMFGTIGAPIGAPVGEDSPLQRGIGLGLDVGEDENRPPRQELQDGASHAGGGFAIGLAPDELARTRAKRRRSAPALVGTPEIVDLTDGALQPSGRGVPHERKWKFGTSQPEARQQQAPSQSLPPPPPPPLPMQMYPHPQPMAMYPPLPSPGHLMNAPEPAVGDEYEARSHGYGEPYVERRGGFSTRRGRYAGGRSGPNGRGFGGRRGAGGPSQHYYAPPPLPPPPPPPPPGPDGYYMGPSYSVPYMPPPAPVPIPVTITSFPIDPTRWYLLGQLEYYFSVQNLVMDLWLRKQMDNRGWVPISVIASFNRVRHLTYDINLVRDVLSLSTLVEVREDRVRMRDQRWVPFVLPDAPATDILEEGDNGTHLGPAEEEYGYTNAEGMYTDSGVKVGYKRQQDVAHAGRTEEDGDCEDEEDVVFVMGRETGERRDSNPAEWSEQRSQP